MICFELQKNMQVWAFLDVLEAQTVYISFGIGVLTMSDFYIAAKRASRLWPIQ